MTRSLLTEEQALRLAQFRVKKGVAWLNQHAPHGWQWNMFYMAEGGRVFVRARDMYDNECVLALAFTYLSEYANQFGYVTYASVSKVLRLTSKFQNGHGFTSTRGVSSEILDAAWAEALLTYARPPSNSFRHPTEVDRLFASDSPQTQGGFFSLWWRRVAS